MIARSICKVKPDRNFCFACLDDQIDSGVYKDCSKCKLKGDEYELVQLVPGLFGNDSAYVLKDGVITRVKLSRIYDVKIKVEGKGAEAIYG